MFFVGVFFFRGGGKDGEGGWVGGEGYIPGGFQPQTLMANSTTLEEYNL